MNISQRGKRFLRRKIHIGDRTVTGEVCPSCVCPTVIYPESNMAAHFAGHDVGAPKITRHHHGGRPVGSKSRLSMSSTGVEQRINIKMSGSGRR